MILRALYDYYHRSGDLPAFGMELKEIGFIIVIDKCGNFLRFEDRRIDKKSAQQFLVKKSVGRSSAPVANYLYDNSQYVFGYSDKGNMESMRKYFDTFKAKIKEIYNIFSGNEAIKAVYAFYQQEPSAIVEIMQNDPLWVDIVKNLNKKYSTFSFLIEGDTEIVASQKGLINLECNDEKMTGKLCSVIGKYSKIVETTTATMIPGSSQATAKLVAFQINSGYDSYGKSKGHNAPISEEAEFAYTTALNHLLRSDSHNKFMVGSRTFLFWTSSNSEASKLSENSLFALLGRADDPNKRIELVRRTFMSIYNGTLSANKDDKFFILGLAPNSARIAVVYWNELPLREFASLISKHFTDMEIVDTRKDKKPYVGLHSILGNVTLGGKSSDASPNLPDAVVKSIFQGLPYPASLFQACIRRIRAEQSVNIVRAAIIKAYLNRLTDNNNKKIDIMLDKENQNQGYLCGRLFAVLDKIQEDANGIHSIRERYMNSASATPAMVFATILNLSGHHLEKLNAGGQVFYEKLKQEIISKLDANGFPAHLDLQDQGRFFVGYYHQRQNFFTSKENKETEEQ
ncbi:type I-C CRISPR-associated protein Cas8c/Csd1 [Phocaeicola sartorii]|uniref:CRISPR-associated protein cas8c/csd1, subtype I-c/dvulg n=1 Tax=Phocaeicola sartorii TaxID=671267 RepID=R9IBZ4_9BACT|nr:type I-C CRISPR-associated protein Cas8c/Csd1 [Phocaeicola sartorii]EOS14869.1 CRISPR-associated protein cas8c/csd1, subtype I-c/dvulg [Phocaeicola sartorii]MCR1846713.1 type I-C CRISPR-associated protein Cas8c/Csd1 [Phocaeicola sartorii]NUL01342.1 type I-C CRISPR-associated protein Cas8c/Csd1 [Phocaeicola sartorii]